MYFIGGCANGSVVAIEHVKIQGGGGERRPSMTTPKCDASGAMRSISSWGGMNKGQRIGGARHKPHVTCHT